MDIFYPYLWNAQHIKHLQSWHEVCLYIRQTEHNERRLDMASALAHIGFWAVVGAMVISFALMVWAVVLYI